MKKHDDYYNWYLQEYILYLCHYISFSIQYILHESRKLYRYDIINRPQLIYGLGMCHLMADPFAIFIIPKAQFHIPI